jgi:hypothetical protein
MLSSTCHCGAVRIDIPAPPEVVTNCNCSLCRRYGALWAYYKVEAVRVMGHPDHTAEYVWGEKTLRTIRCRHCGCVTHWEPLHPGPDSKMAVNIRNFEPAQLGVFRIRRFDGADTWTFLD